MHWGGMVVWWLGLSLAAVQGHLSYHIQVELDTRAHCVKINKLGLGA